MKLFLLLLILPCSVNAQWRAVNVKADDTKSINENFRRASVYSNRKLDKFSNETIHGDLEISASTITFSNGGAISAPTIIGDASFTTATSTATFSGWVDIGMVYVTSNTLHATNIATVTCPAKTKVLGVTAAYCNAGATAPLYFQNASATSVSVYCAASAANNLIAVTCARIK